MGRFEYDDIDEDARREAIDERRARNRATACQCGGDMPGRCPGPQSCPLSDYNDAPDEDDAEGDA